MIKRFAIKQCKCTPFKHYFLADKSKPNEQLHHGLPIKSLIAISSALNYARDAQYLKTLKEKKGMSL